MKKALPSQSVLVNMTALRVSRDLSLSADDDSLQMLTEHALIPFSDVVTYGMGILFSMSKTTISVWDRGGRGCDSCL